VIETEKPGSPADLVHYGKKGMKWGVRNSDIGTASFKKQFPTRQARNQAIQRARGKRLMGESTLTDDAVAKRLKTGEKAALTLLAVTGFATLPIAAFTGVNVASRRRIEKKVLRGS